MDSFKKSTGENYGALLPGEALSLFDELQAAMELLAGLLPGLAPITEPTSESATQPAPSEQQPISPAAQIAAQAFQPKQVFQPDANQLRMEEDARRQLDNIRISAPERVNPEDENITNIGVAA